MTDMSTTPLLDQVHWNEQGLIPAIAQDSETGEVLMMAWMNPEALQLTLSGEHVVYWSRSRGALWHKGEQSGNEQRVKEIYLDCDSDTVLVKVEQVGEVACHTGRRSCFFQRLVEGQWREEGAILKNPSDMYGEQ